MSIASRTGTPTRVALIVRTAIVGAFVLLLASSGGAGPASAFWSTPQSSPRGFFERIRAAHMGGNWGTNVEAVHTLPEDYFDHLNDLFVDWVGITVSLHVDDSMDSTVSLEYSGVTIPTFTDATLEGLIRAFRQRGFKVYLALVFEIFEAEASARPVSRWQLGDPNMPDEDPSVLPENWPWDLDHPNHTAFVAEFWQTYTQQAVHFAQIAEAEGVQLYAIGAETERLFRSRSGGRWPNEFLSELLAMVAAVRAVYSGYLTYDQHYGAVSEPFYSAGSEHLFGDIGLDVVGVSAYFPLLPSPPGAVTGVATLESRWETVFQDDLIPLRQRNPTRPILFTEFGYVNHVDAPFNPVIDEFQPWVFTDLNGNGLDDGEETQANIYEAFFNTMKRHPDLVDGAFLWGMQMASDETWNDNFRFLIDFSPRGKLAEDVVRKAYDSFRRNIRFFIGDGAE